MRSNWTYSRAQVRLMDLMSRMDAPACLCDTWLLELFGDKALERLSNAEVAIAVANLGVLAERTKAYVPPKAGIWSVFTSEVNSKKEG